MFDFLFRDSASGSKSKEDTFEPVQQIIADPLKDLPVFYNSRVTDGKPTDFYILGGQKDIEYILCDKEDVPLISNGNEINAQLLSLETNSETLLHNLRSCRMLSTENLTEIKIPEAEDTDGIEDFARTWRRVAQITTPDIKKDQTFRLLARKKNVAGNNDQLEEYLLQAVSVRVGIDTSLPVQFLSQLGTDVLSEKGDGITINFNQPEAANLPLKIRILQTQEGVNYQIFETTGGDKRIERSDTAVGGTQGSEGNMTIELETTGTFEEDTVLIIRAFRDIADKENSDPLLAADLEQKLNVAVRPNKELEPNFADEKIPYNGSTLIRLDKIQKSVDYQLFARPVELSEYSAGGALEIADVESIGNLIPIGEPKSGKQGGSVSFETEAQQEDSVFIIQATKNNQANGETLRVKKGLVLLVQPSPSPTVTADNSTISKGEEGLVILSETQKGVKYQLQLSKKTIGDYGYHFSERAIGGIVERREFGMRIGTDFKIGTAQDNAATLFGDEKLILPTAPLKKTTTFKVIARKSYTGLETELSEDVTITVGEPSS
ncbi:MAG: hypothetical protein WA584_14855 [Pyrinomonadaceae bacterium]